MDKAAGKSAVSPLDFDEEDAFGEWMYSKLKSECGFETTRSKTRRVRAAMSRLQPVHAGEQRMHARIIHMKDANAFVCPGRYLYISDSLLHLLNTEDAVAFVLGHELGHARLGHLDFFQQRALWKNRPGGEVLGLIIHLTQRFAFSPERERDADAYGLDLCLKAGYDGEKCLAVMEVIKADYLKHDADELVFGPDAARSVPPELIEQWKAKAKVWAWERMHGYPSVEARRSLLEARLSKHQMGIPLAPVGSRPVNREDDAVFQDRLQAIDAALEAWQIDITNAAANFSALTRLPAYRRLIDMLARTPSGLAGNTEQEARSALDVLREIGRQLKRLLDMLDKAEAAHHNLAFEADADGTVRQLEVLLFGDSAPELVLPGSCSDTDGCESSGYGPSTTPKRLLAILSVRFEKARDVVCAIDSVWTDWPARLEQYQNDAAALRKTANLLGSDCSDALNELDAALKTLRQQVETDPLSVRPDADGAAARGLEVLRVQIVTLLQERKVVEAGLQKAARLLDRMKGEAGNSGSSRPAKNGDTIVRSFGEDREERLRDLAEWLEVLQNSWSEGRWQAVCVGLDRWLQAAKAILESG